MMDEDSAHIEMALPLQPELEVLFGEICYSVRDRTAAPAGTDGAASYAVELVQEIETRLRAGDLTGTAYEYCLQAAGEILSLEAVYFENRFVRI